MADNERDLDDLAPEEQALAGRLDALSVQLRELERAETDIDQSFARTLRAHLLYGEELAPHPTFARRLRVHLLARGGVHPLPRPRRRRLAPWLGALAVITGLITAVLLNLPRGADFPVPYPTRADLLFNLPSPRTAISQLSPTLSLVHPSSAIVFTGRLHFTAHQLPDKASKVQAYLLTSEPGVVARSQRLLDIHAPVRRVRTGSSVWLVASDGGGAGRKPLHSLAVSLTSGELVYHDRRNFRLPHASHAASHTVAVAAARHWLARLGWPAAHMPVHGIRPVPTSPKLLQVVLGWHGVTGATIDEATLWVAPDRSVIEAWVWPPVAHQGRVTTRSVSGAWADVTSGRVPTIVEGVAPRTRATAMAVLHRVSTVLLLVPGRGGASYLVPAYRLEGAVRIRGVANDHHWVSLAPGIQH